MKKTLAVLIVICCFSSMAFAQRSARRSRPFQLSLTPEIALHPSDVLIRGLSLSVWGENPQHSLALGIASGSVGDSYGFMWSWLLNYSENYTGLQWAAINYNRNNYLGWQHGLVNYTGGYLKGVQTGWVNYAHEMQGVQLGLFNYADLSRDFVLQLGLVNVIAETERWFGEFPDALAPAMVFVNWRF